MSYGIKYQCDFDALTESSVNHSYSLQILQKDYISSIIPVKGGASPAILSYQEDDPKAPIKGSSLSITLINEGSLPLTDFFSVDDDEFQVQLYWGIYLIWTGYLVQTDCTETLLDYAHEINLSANDNLGLMKSIALDKSQITYDVVLSTNGNFSTTAPNTLTVPALVAASVQNGDVIDIHTLIFDLNLTVLDNSGGTTLIVAETVTTVGSTASITIRVFRPSQFPDKLFLSDVIKLCLNTTNLALNTFIWGQLKETSQSTGSSFIDQTIINTQTFLKDANTYLDCYTILTQIMARFNMAFFQAKGVWNIVRWDELRYYSNTMTAYVYDSDFVLQYRGVMDNVFISAPNIPPAVIPNIFPETGLLHKVLGSFSFDKETFNYKQPAQLLKNFDLQTVGNLISTSTTGSGPTLQTINDYVAPWWYSSTLGVSVTGPYLIRVTLDNLNNEIDRLLVVKGDVKSVPIEVNAGDAFKFSFTFKTQDSQPGVVTLQMIVQLYDGVTTNYFHEDGTWQTGVGWAYVILSGDNTNQWHSVNIDSTNFPIPYSGLMYCYLRVADLSGPINETYYKDIRFEYTALINESSKIIGQTHTSEQSENIKQNGEEEIFIDDSPRNSIAGTLFLNSVTGLLQDRALQWEHPYIGTPFPLGQLITFEQLFWRRVSRSILDGTMYGLVAPLDKSNVIYYTITNTTSDFSTVAPHTLNVLAAIGDLVENGDRITISTMIFTLVLTVISGGGTLVLTVAETVTNITTTSANIVVDRPYRFSDGNFSHVSMLSVFKYTYYNNLNFVFGLLNIDFKNNKFTGTLWEIWRTGEVDGDLTSSYLFNFLYALK